MALCGFAGVRSRIIVSRDEGGQMTGHGRVLVGVVSGAAFAQVPGQVAGEHADQHVGADPVGQPMPGRRCAANPVHSHG